MDELYIANRNWGLPYHSTPSKPSASILDGEFLIEAQRARSPRWNGDWSEWSGKVSLARKFAKRRQRENQGETGRERGGRGIERERERGREEERKRDRQRERERARWVNVRMNNIEQKCEMHFVEILCNAVCKNRKTGRLHGAWKI